MNNFVISQLKVKFEVYPETKGVPLEEMDAVFGEGKTRSLPICFKLTVVIADELEERMEEESERAFLIPNALPTDQAGPSEPDANWFNRLFNVGKKRSDYEPIEQ